MVTLEISCGAILRVNTSVLRLCEPNFLSQIFGATAYHLYFCTMTTFSIDGLEAILRSLGVAVPVPRFPQSDILRKPIDIYKSYLASTASEVLGCQAGLAYEAIQSANIKDNSDLTLVLPKLKWRSQTPRDLAKGAFIKVTHVISPTYSVNSLVCDS